MDNNPQIPVRIASQEEQITELIAEIKHWEENAAYWKREWKLEMARGDKAEEEIDRLRAALWHIETAWYNLITYQSMYDAIKRCIEILEATPARPDSRPDTDPHVP